MATQVYERVNYARKEYAYSVYAAFSFIVLCALNISAFGNEDDIIFRLFCDFYWTNVEQYFQDVKHLQKWKFPQTIQK